MPIKVNLLAEAIAAEEMRRRDPVKRALYAGAFAVALMLVWSSSLMLEGMMQKKDLSLVQTEIQTRTNEFSQVKASTKKKDDIQKKLDALQKLSNGRFLEGNLLNALQQITVSGVQLTRLHVDQAYLYKEGTPGQTNGFGVIPGRPAIDTERIVVTLDAKDYSANPGDQVSKFKTALIKQPYFDATLDKTNGLRMANSSPLQSGIDGRPYVLFTLECRYPDQSR